MKKAQLNIYIDMALFILMGLIFMIALRNVNIQRYAVGLFGVKGVDEFTMCSIVSNTLLNEEYIRYGEISESKKIKNTFDYFQISEPSSINNVDVFVNTYFYSCESFRKRVCELAPEMCNKIAFTKITFYRISYACEENPLQECEVSEEGCLCVLGHKPLNLGVSAVYQNCGILGKSCIGESYSCEIPVYGPVSFVKAEVCSYV